MLNLCIYSDIKKHWHIKVIVRIFRIWLKIKCSCPKVWSLNIQIEFILRKTYVRAEVFHVFNCIFILECSVYFIAYYIANLTVCFKKVIKTNSVYYLDPYTLFIFETKTLCFINEFYLFSSTYFKVYYFCRGYQPQCSFDQGKSFVQKWSVSTYLKLILLLMRMISLDVNDFNLRMVWSSMILNKFIILLIK